jgi:carbamoyl-phosphate synthase/aspartate carbamoyltransferase/dihydroorotase
MITIPGLIDPHVHLREPGATHKEDFLTGTKAALAGGFTTILDMPNNTTPITTLNLLTAKQKIAKEKILCDVGFHFGSLGNNLSEFEKVQNKIFGLKLYLNQTTGSFIIGLDSLPKIFHAWPKNHPILLHAEENILEKALALSNQFKQPVHVCHISSAKELTTILNAKNKGWQVTCGVTPHHLFLSINNLATLGILGNVKPALKKPSDLDFLWQHLSDIDLIESDHAPHTLQEKEQGAFGFPGLETTLPLLLTAVHQNKLTIDDIVRLCHTNPAKIFKIPTDPDTKIEINENEEWTIQNQNLFTKCKWSPFNNWKMTGKIKTVFIRGNKVFEDGKILTLPSSGKLL